MPLKGDFADQAPASAPISHISSLSSVDKPFLGVIRPIAKWALRPGSVITGPGSFGLKVTMDSISNTVASADQGGTLSRPDQVRA
jgi:hypothetical protein